MAYIALYRKWRPKEFEDVVGQSHITKTLQKAIETDKVAHAYLFSGPRGTGKTSTAKIFARAMNCVRGPTSHPCNECEVCRHIMSGESLDVVEIDAASNRSIEDIRTLRETIKFMPAEGHKKIYIIDEVHMLTTEAFNALLKTLEEPPAHVIFILATTEPERIPMTILSRCQRYEFRRITSHDIGERILYVAKEEHIKITRGAAHILAVQADGGMRDALSMLDQCVSNADGTIDETLVRSLLGLIGKDWLFAMAGAVFDGKGDAIIKGVDDIIRMGKEPVVILTEFLEHLRAIMLYQAAPQSDTLSAYDDCMKELAAQAKSAPAGKVFGMIRTMQQSLLMAKTSPVPRVAVEMGLLMASRATSDDTADNAPAEITVPASVLDRLTRLEQIVRSGTFQPGAPQSAYALPDEPAYTEMPDAPSPVSVQTDIKTPAAQHKKEAAAPVQAAPVSQPVSPAKTVVSAQYQDVWKQVCAILDKQRKKAILSCIRNGRIIYIGDGMVIVAFKTAFMAKQANREGYFTFVDAALDAVLGGKNHMQGFQEGDPELAAYEQKKNAHPDKLIASPPVPEPREAVVPTAPPVPEQEHTPQQTAAPAMLQPASFQDMSPEERAVLDPLLNVVGDCNIYIEQK